MTKEELIENIKKYYNKISIKGNILDALGNFRHRFGFIALYSNRKVFLKHLETLQLEELVDINFNLEKYILLSL